MAHSFGELQFIVVDKIWREQWLNPGWQDYEAAGGIAAVRKWRARVT